MSEIREATCDEDRGGCGVVCFWAVTEANAKWVLVDWDGSDEGDFYVVHNDGVPAVGGNAAVPVVVHRASFDSERHRLMRRGRRHLHFATCPERDQFRRTEK